jgi:multidrug resistance efflux pump
MAWFTLGEVDVQVVGTEARIVVEDKTHAVQSPLSGRLVSRKVELGIEVREGDVLAELDTSVQQRQLFEARTRVKGIEPQLEVLGREIAAFEGATDAERAEANVRLAQGAARRDEGELRAKIAEELAERKERLAKAGIISELDQLQNDATAAQERKAMQVLELELSRLQAESLSAASRDKRELEALRRARVELDGIRETVQASISVLEAEIEQRTIRAPVNGTVGELGEQTAGSFINVGDTIAVIVPESPLKAITYLPAGEAIGRVVVGQHAELRLDSFPWAQFGTVDATVAKVAGEATAGLLRVEMEVHPHPRIPLQHGLVGTAEVNVEQVAPAVLVLRSVGKAVSKPSSPASGAAAPTATPGT